MAISDRINEMYTHVGEVYDTITNVDLPTNKNIENIPSTIRKSYLDIMNNGIDTIYDNWEKVNGTGTSISLNNTEEAPMTIEYKGNTSQEGTPTPTTPQDIHIVSGDNYINVCGKNLFKGTLYNGIINQGGTYISNANRITNADSSTMKTFILKKGTYTLSIENIDACTIVIKNESGSVIQEFADSWKTLPYTFTTTNDGYFYFSAKKNIDSALTPSDYKPMLEKGSTATTYEAYKGASYEINLGKNLLNIDGTRTSEGLTNTTTGTIISVSGTSSNTYSSLTQQITQNIPIGTYTFSIQETYSKRIGFISTFSDSTSTTYFINANTLSTTFTTTKEIISYRLYMETSSATVYNMTIKPQLEKGSQATSFSPYFTPIELCKIGTYQDSIVKDNGKWYLNKQIGKVVLNGSENWTSLAQGTNSWYVSNLIDVMFIDTTKTIMSNLFYGIPNSQRDSTSYTNKIYVDQWKNTIIRDTTLTTKVQVQSATSGTPIYYVLATPTYTEITGELLNQLEAIKKSYENQTNINQENNDLPFELEVGALEKY